MRNNKVGNRVSMGSILAIIGALVVLASLFLGYITTETLGLTGWTSESTNGIDIITGGKDGTDGLSFVHWAPLIAVVTAVIGAIIAIASTFVESPVHRRTCSIVLTMMMVISVIFTIVFIAMGAGEGLFTGDTAELINGFIEMGVLKMGLGAGAYVGLVGAIIGLIGAGIDIKENI